MHQFNPNLAPDSDFETGSLEHLLENNFCRLLDQRRTPGKIEAVDLETGFFRWRISDFEDKGRSWDVPIEDVVRYQFAKNSQVLNSARVRDLARMVDFFSEPLIITPTLSQQEKFQRDITDCAQVARKWLRSHSDFFRYGHRFDLQKTQGSPEISSALMSYLAENGVEELERKTADIYVLNPQSGEWMKGLQIAVAEAGLKEFRGTVVRTKDLFKGIGAKQIRQRYVQLRIGFVVAMFDLFEVQEVTLYRGMSTDLNWSTSSPRFFSSWTFSKKVADAFARLEPHQTSKNSYLLKRTISTRKLFMTYVETAEMNNQYEEVEAVVAHDSSDEKLW